MARALSLSLLFLLFAPLIKTQETLLRKAYRLTVLCLFIVLASTTARAQQRILWQGRVRPDQINVYTSASLSDRATITLKQGDVVDVVLQINTMGVGWCQVSFSTQSEPLGYVLCLGLEQNGVAPNHLVHSEAVATESAATSASPKLTTVAVVDSAVLTNKDILDMNRIGLPPQILVAKIKSSQCNFDTSSASLQVLKAGGLGDSVILAMVEAPSGPARVGPVEDPTKAPNASSHPDPTAPVAGGHDVQTLSAGFYYNTAQGWQKLEPILLAGGGMKHVGKMFVPGLTPQMVWTFRGAESPIQIEDKRPTFCIKESPEEAGIAGRSEHALLIVRFDKKKDHRELQTTNGGNVFTFKGGLSKDRMPDITTKTASDGVFMVTPTEDLKPGEYMITFDALGFDGYDFGVRD
jgi:hypothetical protein